MNEIKSEKVSIEKSGMKYSSSTHLSYSIGQMVKQFLEVAFTIRVFFYYENEVLLPVLLVGIGYIIYGFWNMINDPLVGFLSDKSKRFTKRWGKRFPWIMLGVFGNILAYLLVFTPPEIDVRANPSLMFLYFLIVICLFDGCFSLFTINYYSIFPLKFTSDDERRKVNGIKTILAQIGLFLAVLIPPMFIEYGNKQSYLIAAAVVSLFATILAISMIKGVREDKELKETIINLDDSREHENFFKNLKLALKQKNFTAYVVSATLFNIFAIIIMASLPFLVRYILNMPAETESLLLVGFLLTAVISVPAWTKFSKKYGNKYLYTMGFFISMVLAFLFLFIQEIIFAMILMLLAGISVGALWVGTFLILSDVIDESVLLNKKRQEGIYFGIVNFFGRLEIVAQALVFTIVHILTGFEAGASNQDALALWGLRIQISIIPMVSMLIGGLIFWKFYDLAPERVKSIQDELKKLDL
jgi:GPH family glycoside/pentoside/hexuronide:cation symporter